MEFWSFISESNQQPADYKSAALPLSHISILGFATLIIIPNFLRKVNPYREFSFKKYFVRTKSAYAGRFTVVTTHNVWYNDTYRNSRWERAAFHGL